MLKKSEILDFIEQDKSDERKRQAREGERYYEGEHDIKNYKLYYYNGDGELTEDKTRSNIKISHPFFTELVDQQVQYMLSGKEGFAFSEDTELQKILDEYFNNNETLKLSCLTWSLIQYRRAVVTFTYIKTNTTN